jgi:peptidyl-prolyl cis-trans isomerase C
MLGFRRSLVFCAFASAAVFATACKESKDQNGLQISPADQKTKAQASTATGAAAAIELPPGDGPVATVNGVGVAREAFNKEYKTTMERYQKARHEVQPALRERLKDNIVRRLVDAELIRQQAEKLGVTVNQAEKDEQWGKQKQRYGTEEAFQTFLQRAGTTADDVRTQFEQNLLREKVFAKVTESLTVTAAEVKDFYEKNQQRYDEPEQVQASHILLRVAANAPEAEKAEKKKKAEEILKKAKAKGADFAALAKEFGEDPTKDRGGDLGYFTKGRMVKPFEDAVWNLKKGQIAGVVETQFGYHIIKKVDHKQPRRKPFKEVEEQIKKSLEAKKRNESIRDALAKWKNEAKIEIFVKGDEKIIASSRPQTGPQGVLPNVNPASKIIQETGGVKVQRLGIPNTKDLTLNPQGQPMPAQQQSTPEGEDPHAH